MTVDLIEASIVPSSLEDLEFDELVALGRKVEGRYWFYMGALADAVEVKFAEGDLQEFAKRVGVAYKTLCNYRTVYRAWSDLSPAGEVSFSTAREIAASPLALEFVAMGTPVQECRKIAREDRPKKPKAEPAAKQDLGTRPATPYPDVRPDDWATPFQDRPVTEADRLAAVEHQPRIIAGIALTCSDVLAKYALDKAETLKAVIAEVEKAFDVEPAAETKTAEEILDEAREILAAEAAKLDAAKLDECQDVEADDGYSDEDRQRRKLATKQCEDWAYLGELAAEVSALGVNFLESDDRKHIKAQLTQALRVLGGRA